MQGQAMAVVLTTAIGAVLNAGTFIGGSYLAKYLSGKDQDEERKRHDRALEKFQKDYNDWKKSVDEFEMWKERRRAERRQAGENLASTDDALGEFSEATGVKPDDLREPEFGEYYRPSKSQKQGEILFTVLSVAGLAFGVSRFS